MEEKGKTKKKNSKQKMSFLIKHFKHSRKQTLHISQKLTETEGRTFGVSFSGISNISSRQT